MLILSILLIYSNILCSDTIAAPRNSAKLESMPEYVDLLENFKKLQSVKTKDEMKSIVTLGLIAGAMQVQKDMKENLFKMVSDMLANIDTSVGTKASPKIEKIESTVRRDRTAILILGKALDLARGDLSIDEYRGTVKKLMRVHMSERRKLVKNEASMKISDRLEKLKGSLTSHMDTMKEMLRENSYRTLEFLALKHGVYSTEGSDQNDTTTEFAAPAFDSGLIYSEPIEDNIIEDVRREDINVVEMPSMQNNEEKQENNSSQQAESGKEFDDFPIEVNINASSMPPGGLLAGLLASLSGGEGGSDVGALVGALTGVVMNLFGPGGLDIPSLLSAGSALLSGLLSGNRNFGTVLGEYVGLAVDGFSGGGGAINNGRFFGNLLGTIVAELSADPEDDDLPPKPLIFLQNFLSSFSGAKSKTQSDTESSGEEMSMDDGSGGSFGFITRIVKAIVGGITSFILNASLGSSSGSSKSSSTH